METMKQNKITRRSRELIRMIFDSDVTPPALSFDREDKNRIDTHIVVEGCQLGLQEDRLWLFELGEKNQVNL